MPFVLYVYILMTRRLPRIKLWSGLSFMDIPMTSIHSYVSPKSCTKRRVIETSKKLLLFHLISAFRVCFVCLHPLLVVVVAVVVYSCRAVSRAQSRRSRRKSCGLAIHHAPSETISSTANTIQTIHVSITPKRERQSGRCLQSPSHSRGQRSGSFRGIRSLKVATNSSTSITSLHPPSFEDCISHPSPTWACLPPSGRTTESTKEGKCLGRERINALLSLGVIHRQAIHVASRRFLYTRKERRVSLTRALVRRTPERAWRNALRRVCPFDELSVSRIHQRASSSSSVSAQQNNGRVICVLSPPFPSFFFSSPPPRRSSPRP